MEKYADTNLTARASRGAAAPATCGAAQPDAAGATLPVDAAGSEAGRKNHLTAYGSVVGALIGLVILSLAVTANTLNNGFVYDDAWQVAGNVWIRDVRFIPEILTSDVWRFDGHVQSSYYRPLMHLVYMAAYYIFGPAPWGFHLVNILLHALVSALAFLTILRLLRQFLPAVKGLTLPALAGAALFATHPVHTEVVAWIAAVPDLTFTLFCLWSWYLYAGTREKNRETSLLSVIAYFIATLCKEPAFLFPAVFVAYDYCLGRQRGDRLFSFRRYAPYAAAAALSLMLRASVLGTLLGTEHTASLSGIDALINVFPLFSDYLVKLVWPADLNAFTLFEPVSSLLTVRGGSAVLVTAAFAGFLVISFRKSRPVFLGLVLITVPLLPALFIPALPENVFAERYLYFPSFGFSLIAATAVARVDRGRRPFQAGVWTLVLAVTALFSAATVSRNAIWKDDETFYRDIVKKSPQSAMMHVNLGWTYYQAGRFDDALAEYTVAMNLKPGLAEPHNNAGLIYEQRNQIFDAIREYQTALALQPDYEEAHNNLGNAYLRINAVDDAIREYHAALDLSPRFTAAHYNLANAYAETGRFPEAVREYQEAIALDPDEPDAHNNLGQVYLNLNRFNEAIEQFETALLLSPGHAPARRNLEMVGQGRR
jgi:tetratricopeptide (TPR) repeat protein